MYRNRYKILKKTVYGVDIKTKTIPLRHFNNLMPKTDSRLKSSWNVLTKEDVESLTAIHEFQQNLERILLECTIEAKRFGDLICVENKLPLEEDVNWQVKLLKEKLGKPLEQNSAGDSLASHLERSRIALIDYLLPQAMENQGCWDQLFEHERSLKRKLDAKEIAEGVAIKQAVETFVDAKLRFPDAQGMIDKIRVEYDYYDISDELLAKQEFMDIIDEHELQVREYEQGYAQEAGMADEFE
jgi:hypothetical protein